MNKDIHQPVDLENSSSSKVALQNLCPLEISKLHIQIKVLKEAEWSLVNNNKQVQLLAMN